MTRTVLAAPSASEVLPAWEGMLYVHTIPDQSDSQTRFRDSERPRRRPAGQPKHPRGARPAAPALDTSTVPAAIPSGTAFVDEATGEISEGYDPTVKWELQAYGRKILGHGHRLRICFRHLLPMSAVEIRERIEGGSRFLGGLQVCGSVWVCPVCATKIQSERVREVRSAIEAWEASGGSVLHMVQTFRHTRWDDLASILERFNEARRSFRDGRSYQDAKAALGLSGTITSLEVTWGEVNGWHPHAHGLLFVAGGVGPADARRELWPAWRSAAERRGLDVDPRAFRVQGGSSASRYVTKLGREYRWDSADELVRSHTKHGRIDSVTPFDLLRAHGADRDDPRWPGLFRDYAAAFRRRKQLVWSRGLKQQLLGTDGQSDEAVAASLGEPYEVLATLGAADWYRIRKSGHHGGTVLQVYNLAGEEGLRTWLGTLNAAA